jgi:hypothetical protein
MKTKRSLFLLAFISLIQISFAQSLSKAAIRDFATVCSYNLKYDNNSYLTAALLNGLARKYGAEQAYRIMGSVETDAKSRSILFSAFHELGTAERVSIYLSDWGVNPAFAKEIALYIDTKYAPKTEPIFQGTRKFTDGDGWNYVVTINQDKITLKLYPSAKNEFYKDKSKPKRITTGIIKDGEIITKQSGYKFENGNLYEENYEGGWNEYRPMGK